METKPGYKTTEFFALLVVAVVDALNQSGLWNYSSNAQSNKWTAIVAAAYAISRGIAKAGVKPDA